MPFLIKKVEHNLEIFLFVMGILAVTISGLWSFHLIEEAFVEPVKITVAVGVAGLIFKKFQNKIRNKITMIADKMGHKLFLFCLVVILGLASSVITAIIASLVLVEIITGLKYEKKVETNIVIITCFAIGLGAALTPIGEPLSTIAIAKLRYPPHNADFWYLAKLLWAYIIPEILILGLIASYFHTKTDKAHTLSEDKQENVQDILLRTGKVYLFVMALIFLGTGFQPIIDQYISKLSSAALYWINISSAILDNATLTAAEITHNMTTSQIKAILLGLLVAGGMLIPGNIPNIISAGKLKISSKNWAKLGVPLGLIIMLVNFLILFL